MTAYEVRGGKGDGVYVVAERGGPIVASFYALEEEPGWWRGHSFGQVRQVYEPGDVNPVDVARRFLHRP